MEPIGNDGYPKDPELALTLFRGGEEPGRGADEVNPEFRVPRRNLEASMWIEKASDLSAEIPFSAHGDSRSLVFSRDADNVTVPLRLPFAREGTDTVFLSLEVFSKVAEDLGLRLVFN